MLRGDLCPLINITATKQIKTTTLYIEIIIIIIIIINSVHSLISRSHSRSPPFAVSAHSPQSFLSVAVLLSCCPVAGKSQCSYELSEMSWFYGLGNHGAFGGPGRILWDTGTDVISIKAGPFREKRDELDPYTCTITAAGYWQNLLCVVSLL